MDFCVNCVDYLPVSRLLTHLPFVFYVAGQEEEAVEYDVIHFREISSHILKDLCCYFTYKKHYTNCIGEIPEFPIKTEHSLDLLTASFFLNC